MNSRLPIGLEQDIDPVELTMLDADRLLRACAGAASFGLSPAAIALAFSDWWTHLGASPGKQADLLRKGIRKWIRYSNYLRAAPAGAECPRCIEPLPQDLRFAGAAWQQWPFNAIHQGFLLYQQWWHNATTGVRGVSPHHEDVVNFTMRQMIDVWAPSNFILGNPEVLRATADRGGLNLVNGAANFIDDWRRAVLGQPDPMTARFRPGVEVAATRGEVVMRNDLAELIQYSPARETVYSEPILVVPAWIMKYYILDLSPAESLVEYLVGRGHTVFMISWKNPGPADRELAMEDYRRLGVMASLEAIGRIVPGRRVHAAGYCLGGTLLAIAAAVMARDRDERCASLTFLASQVDFEEAGELSLFIDDSQVSLLEDMMAARGFLDTRQMAGAFQLLRSNDLIWSRRVNDYLLGKRAPMTALMAWNADATRMPYRMHSEYLRRIFLRNEISAGRYAAAGAPVALSDIAIPIFAVGTAWDHVAPWRSVYKIGLYTDSEVTFLLASGGHNAGIVNPPGRGAGGYQVAKRDHGDPHVDPDTWLAQSARHAGSWWPEWQRWLAARSGARVPPPPVGNAAAGGALLGAAPGQYVLQR